MEFFRGALSHYLKELGAEDAAAVTNTQGQPLYRLSMLPSLGAALHVPNQS
jgi:hypothetical protein